MSITYETKLWSYYFNNGFTLRDSLFRSVKLTKIVDSDKYSYSGYNISFDVRGTSLLPNGSFCKSIVIFGADMSSSVYISNKKKIS